MSENLPGALRMLTEQKNVRLINPAFFYNENEEVFSRVIANWLENVLCVKFGVYLSQEEEEDETETMESVGG